MCKDILVSVIKLIMNHELTVDRQKTVIINQRLVSGLLSEKRPLPLVVRLNNDEQNAGEPRAASAGGPPTLPPVGRQWPAGLMLAYS